MNLSDRPRWRLLTLCALYLVQGIPAGFVTITLAAFLAEQGASAAQVAAFVAVGWLPWGVKLFFGPLVDRFTHSAMGRRRPWILGAEVGMITVLVTMIAIPDLAGRLLVLTALVFVGNLFNALQDVSTDGMAVDLLQPEERGRANGAMWSAKILGIVIGGAGMSTVMASSGLRAALAVQLTLVISVMLLPLTIREREGERRFPWSVGKGRTSGVVGGDPLSGLFATLRRMFSAPRARLAGVLALLAPLPTRMLVALGPIFVIQEAGWSDTAFAQFVGGPALLAGVAGALLGGRLADRLGRQRVMVAAVVGIALLFSLFALAEPGWDVRWVMAVFLLFGILLDMTLKIALASQFMFLAEKEAAATHFIVYMTLGNMSNVLGSAIIIPLEALFSYQTIFFCAAGFNAVTLGLLKRLAVKAPAMVLSEAEGATR